MILAIEDELKQKSQSKHDAEDAKDAPKARKFTDEENAYLYWYLFHPESLLANARQVRDDLHLKSQTELQDKSKSLRYRVRQYFGIDVPPSPWGAGGVVQM